MFAIASSAARAEDHPKTIAGIVAGSKDHTTLLELVKEVEVDGKTVKLGGAKVTAVDLKASNGVVHVIDTVLMPAK